VTVTHPTMAAGLLILLGAGLGALTPVAWGVLQRLLPLICWQGPCFLYVGSDGRSDGGITFFGWVTGRFGVPTTVAAIGLVMGIAAVSAWRFLNKMSDRPRKRETRGSTSH